MQQGDYALLMASAVLGPGIPAGAYLVARAEPAQPGAPAVLWDSSVPRAVIATDGGGLRLEPSPRMLDASNQPLHRVVAIIMADAAAAPAQPEKDGASGGAA
jgi:hypothetical protein